MSTNAVTQFLTGFTASCLIAFISYRKHSLTLSGACSAVIVGTLLYGFGTGIWYIPLLAFFISSSLLSNWKASSKKSLEDQYQKTGRRDAGQVFANGGIPAVICILNTLWPASYWWPLCIGALASVNADTWATEIGTALKGRPRSILTWHPVSPGTSGGVSIAGSLAAVCGSLFLAGTAVICLVLFQSNAEDSWKLLFSISLGGIIGAFADSLLGATVQALYKCQVCSAVMERSYHHGRPCEQIRGLKWMTNDVVNFLSALVGGFVALLVFYLTK